MTELEKEIKEQVHAWQGEGPELLQGKTMLEGTPAGTGWMQSS